MAHRRKRSTICDAAARRSARTLKANGPQPDGITPSTGVGVFDRMGAKLPDLPPEKEYKGPVDEAYGAYQRATT
jgi:hypothetical protein